jgi:hypothetical protein
MVSRPSVGLSPRLLVDSRSRDTVLPFQAELLNGSAHAAAKRPWVNVARPVEPAERAREVGFEEA